MEYISAPSGNERREATEPRRGYLYQDYRTALEWFKIDDDEVLFVEVTEDYLTRGERGIEAAQVKHIAAPSSLISKHVRDAIFSFIELRSSHQEDHVRFVFISSGGYAREKEKKHRPGDIPALKYWNEASDDPTIDVAPLKEALLNTKPEQPVFDFIEQRNPQELRRDLIENITWIFHAGDVNDVRDRLNRKLAAELEKRGAEPADSFRYASRILDQVVNCAIKENRNERRLTKQHLNNVLAEIASTRISNRELNELHRKALIAENLPVRQIDQQVQKETEELRLSRWFVGYDHDANAEELANKVLPSGSYFGANPGIRARALSWAARVLSASKPEFAKDLLRKAESLKADLDELKVSEALVYQERSQREAFHTLKALRGPLSNTARYLIVRQRPSDELKSARAIRWFKDASLSIGQFDEDGQALIIRDLLHAGEWDALSEIETSLKAQHSHHPFMLLNLAILDLCKATHPLSRAQILDFPPVVQADHFHLYDSTQGIRWRRNALETFTKLMEVARGLDLGRVEVHAHEYQLWLRTRDASLRNDALSELLSLVTAEEGWERWVPLALGANLSFDKSSRRETLITDLRTYKSLNFDQARALLAFFISSREESADLIAEYRDALCDHFESEFLLYMEFSGYLATERLEQAKNLIGSISSRQLRFQCEKELQVKSDGFSKEATIDSLEATYKQTGAAIDLENIIEALANRKDWDRVVPYAGKLFEELQDVRSAEQYIGALSRSGNYTNTRDFFEGYPEFSNSSPELARCYIQVLLNDGNAKALKRFVPSAPIEESQKRIALVRAALIEIDRLSLGQLVTDELTDPAGVSAKELTLLSTIAAALNRETDSRDLAVRATERAPSDPGILMWAYLHATRSMWGNEDQASRWMKSAVDNSGDEGPVFTASFKDLQEMLPAWHSRAKATWEDLSAGRVWLQLHAANRNLQLSQALIGQADLNYRNADARQRLSIPAFSGSRESRKLQKYGAIGIDHTTILLLAYLGMLERLQLLADNVYVPHGTGAWLLEELSQAKFHQPAQIDEAQKILEFTSHDNVRVVEMGEFAINDAPIFLESTASGVIGLAINDGGNINQSVAVLGSRMNLEDSAGAFIPNDERFSSIVCDLCCLFDALNEYGSLPESEYRAANDFVKAIGSSFITQAKITQGAEIVLDDLALKYLAHLDLLDCLAESDFSVVISTDARDDARRLSKVKTHDRRHQALLHEVFAFLERSVNAGLVHILPQPEERWGKPEDATKSTLDLISCAEKCDALFVDDRFFNSWSELKTLEGRKLPVYCTLDILAFLREERNLSDCDYYAALTRLRRSGFCLIPIDAEEISFHADKAVLKFGSFRETESLSSIRESISLLQLHLRIDVRSECSWYRNFLEQLGLFLEAVSGLPDVQSRIAARNWFLELADLSRFSDCFELRPDVASAQLVRNHAQVKLIIDVLSHDYERRDLELLSEYFFGISWSNGRDFVYLVEQTREMITDLAEHLQAEDASADPFGSKRAFVGLLLSRLPKTLREEVLSDREWLRNHSISTSSEITLSAPERPRFESEQLYNLSASVAADDAVQKISDSDGREWAIDRDQEGALKISKGGDGYCFSLPHLHLALSNAEERVQYINDLIQRLAIPHQSFEDVFYNAEMHALSAADILEFDRRLNEWPNARTAQIADSIKAGHASLIDLIPDYRAYYSGLLSKVQFPLEDGTLHSASESDALDEDSVLGKVKDRLLVCAWEGRNVSSLLSHLSDEGIAKLTRQVCHQADPMSVVALLEGILGSVQVGEADKSITVLLRRLNEIGREDSTELRLFVEIAKVVDFRIRSLFGDDDASPLFRRRSAFAHSSIVMRAFDETGFGIDTTIQHMEAKSIGYLWSAMSDLQSERAWSPYFLAPRFISLWIRQRLSAALRAREDYDELMMIGQEQCEDWARFSLQEGVDDPTVTMTPFARTCPAADAFGKESKEIIRSLNEDDDVSSLIRWAQAAFVGCAVQISGQAQEALAKDVDENFVRELQSEGSDEVANCLVLLSNCAVVSDSQRLQGAALRAAEHYRRICSEGAPAVTYFVSASVLAGSASNHDEWIELISRRAYDAAAYCVSRKEALALRQIFEWLCLGDWKLDIALGRARVELGLLLGDPCYMSPGAG